MPPSPRKKDQHQDRDFYCSFTNLALPNPSELPYTLHNPKHRAPRQQHQQQRPMMHATPRHRRIPSAGEPRPDSFDSTKTTSTCRSFFSTSSSSSSSRRRLLAKVKQLFRGREPTHAQVQMLRASSRKPSTLDFRCVGMESKLDMGGVFACEKDDEPCRAPRLDVALPGESDAYGWGRWFEGVF